MLKNCQKRAFVFLVCVILIMGLPHTRFFGAFNLYAYPHDVYVKGTTVNVRSGPGTNYSIIGTVPLGYKLSPVEEMNDASGNGRYWYRFRFNNQNGYIRTDFTKEMTAYTYDAMFEADLNMKGFPESYKEALRDLHATFPNWIFVLHRTGLDFNYVLENELIGTRTLVNATSISSYKSTDEGKYDFATGTWPTFDGNAWVAASREVTAAYLDPRNFLYTPYVFQFEHHSFNPSIHTLLGVEEMVKGTFLEERIETEGINANASNESVVHPFIGGSGISNQPLSPIDIGNIMPVSPSNGSNIIYPGQDLLPQDSNLPVVPMLMNTQNEVVADTNVIAFSNVITNGNVIENLGPAANIINGGNVFKADIIDTTESIIDEAPSFNYTYLPKGTYTYAEIIFDACRQVNLNPYVVVSMILQEQGKNGTESVSGTNNKFKGYYNYGNINAFAGGGLTSIENGLKYAAESGSYNRPWNTKEKGIYGLCDFYANSYVYGGQDTFYLKKWNVQGENLFKHQYMTNVAGAAAEGQLLGNAYDEILLQLPHEFKIPYYENMPENRCEMPTKDGSPNNRLKNLYVANYILTPTFAPNVSEYSIIVDSNVDNVFINAEAYDSKAAIGGIGNIKVQTSYTIAKVICAAENGNIKEYNINIYKKGAENVVAQNNEEVIPIIFGNNTQNNIINNEENYGPGAVIPRLGVEIGVAPWQ